ncbi:hypothetical protein Q644_12925 [Brucella intermedia 229E]|uniref:Aspartate/glutamate racemase family protein n=1 Tax=Brucella intermedia 229E TaxID=1337887 RepID=U4VDF1_9HYPH|nr:hypothetical protein Q644_12925 [Brucella intermedia 229E]
MAYFQEEVAEAVDIPVFLSSLMQIPFMHAVARGTVGVITANAERLSPRHFAASGIPETIPIVLAGMEDQAEFREAILEEKGTLDSAAIEREVCEVAMKLVRDNPEVRSILLECSDLPPPYAHAVQKVTGRPVFDFISMINYVQQTVACRAYHGFM